MLFSLPLCALLGLTLRPSRGLAPDPYFVFLSRSLGCFPLRANTVQDGFGLELQRFGQRNRRRQFGSAR